MLKISLNYRNLDYENYLTVLLLPKSSRAAAFSVRAFNVELARVSNKNLTYMRAAWSSFQKIDIGFYCKNDDEWAIPLFICTAPPPTPPSPLPIEGPGFLRGRRPLIF